MSYGGASHRREEKEEMKRLNDRLGQYIQKVKTHADMGGINNQTFANLFKQMEDDLNALRKMNDREMDGLRNELMQEKNEKNRNKAEADKNKKLADDLDDKNRQADAKNRALQSENSDLQRKVNQLERDLYEERQAAKAPRDAVSKLQSQMSAVDGKNEELQRRLGEEMCKRKAAEDKADQLQKKLNYNDGLNKEQMKKADELLNQSKDHIAKLENQCKQLEKQGQTYPDLLEKMRQKMDAELEAYKRDCEDTHRRNLADMKHRLDAQGGTIQELRNANHALQAENDKLKDKITQLEAQIKELQKQKSALEDAVNRERGRGADAVRDLDRKNKDLSDKLHNMMQDANADKDQSCRLRQEINHYDALLKDEEKRMRTNLNPAYGTGMTRPMVNSAYRPSSRMSNASGGNLNDKTKYMQSGDDFDRSGAKSSMGVAGEPRGPPNQYGRRNQLTEYTDKYRGGYRAPGGPMTARGGYQDSLPYISNRQGDLRKSDTYGQTGSMRYNQPAQAY